MVLHSRAHTYVAKHIWACVWKRTKEEIRQAEEKTITLFSIFVTGHE
jgi:hypothetical protein